MNGMGDVLARHAYTYPDSFCCCGEYVGASPWVDHPAHVEAALVAAGFGDVGQAARDERAAVIAAIRSYAEGFAFPQQGDLWRQVAEYVETHGDIRARAAAVPVTGEEGL